MKYLYDAGLSLQSKGYLTFLMDAFDELYKDENGDVEIDWDGTNKDRANRFIKENHLEVEKIIDELQANGYMRKVENDGEYVTYEFDLNKIGIDEVPSEELAEARNE